MLNYNSTCLQDNKILVTNLILGQQMLMTASERIMSSSYLNYRQKKLLAFSSGHRTLFSLTHNEQILIRILRNNKKPNPD
uniref:Uncharacterized protein n=1 Tax=Rhizophora mucronata TaxID=61149 RepID=A0A2P2QX10_RHIMU